MMHLDLDELAAGLAGLAVAPRDVGRVALVVVRQPGEKRVLPGRVSLDCALGVLGDRWALAANRKLAAQVTLMRADVAALMAADGDIVRFGDNLFVHLDLSEQNLPAGTRLHIGSAVLELTSKPHTGCKKFLARAGTAALAMTRDPRWLADRLRGIHARVLQAGEVANGDVVRVERR